MSIAVPVWKMTNKEETMNTDLKQNIREHEAKLANIKEYL